MRYLPNRKGTKQIETLPCIAFQNLCLYFSVISLISFSLIFNSAASIWGVSRASIAAVLKHDNKSQ